MQSTLTTAPAATQVTTSHPVNHLDRVWTQMSSADRHALLGHDRDELTAADKVRLATVAAALKRRASRRR